MIIADNSKKTCFIACTQNVIKSGQCSCINSVNANLGNDFIQRVSKRFTFDCWYKEDGIPLKRHINATTPEIAETLFKEQNPDMDCDYPYE